MTLIHSEGDHSAAQFMQRIRRRVHQFPELGYKEHATSDLISKELTDMNVPHVRGLGTTGIVASLKNGTSDRAIALRADMDALPIQEENTFAHASCHDGVMHACGHDGHTAMLLGAIRQFSQKPKFDGTVHFIFQPAEEGLAGAAAMMRDGLFDRFPVEAVYGMHNWPAEPAGTFGICPGPMMASYDTFDIAIQGKGGHAAIPNEACDPIFAGSQIVTLIQALAAEKTDVQQPSVIKVTRFHSGDAYNVIPDQANVGGSVRTLNADVRSAIETRVHEIAGSIATLMNVECAVTYNNIYPVLVNDQDHTTISADVATKLVGEEKVERAFKPALTSEDFAFMLEQQPGAYIFIGSGDGQDPAPLHHPRYDFNDDVLSLGAAYWCALVESQLPLSTISDS